MLKLRPVHASFNAATVKRRGCEILIRQLVRFAVEQDIYLD